MKSVFAFFVALTLTASAHAGKKIDKVETLDLGYVTGEELDLAMLAHQPMMTASMQCSSNNGTLNVDPVTWEVIVNIGRAIWAVINKGQPTYQETYNVATALPQGTRCWNELSRWKKPIMKRIQYTFFAGTSYTKLNLAVVAVTGGSKAGKGQYVAYTSGFAESMKNYGIFNKLNVNVEIPTVFNEGDDENPIGALLMTVRVSNETPIVDRIEGKAIHVSGTGAIVLTEENQF